MSYSLLQRFREQTVWLRRVGRGAFIGAMVGLLVILVGICPWMAPNRRYDLWLEGVENRSLDLRFQMRGIRQTTAPVVLVTIDEKTLAKDGRAFADWLPNHARVIHNLNQFGASAIGLDIILQAEPRDQNESKTLMAAILEAEGKVVLSAAISWDAQGRHIAQDSLPDLVLAATSAAEYRRKPAIGYANLPNDRDGSVRTYADVLDSPELGTGLPTFPFLLALRQQPALRVVLGESPINFVGPAGTLTRVRYEDLLAPEARKQDALREMIFGKVVIVGRADVLNRDFFITPFGRMAGMEVMGNAVATRLEGRPLRRAQNPWRESLALLWLSIGMGTVLMSARPLRAAFVTLCALLLWFAVAQLSFQLRDVWLPVAAPMLVVALTFTATFIGRQVFSEQEISVLGLYCGPTVRRMLQRDPRALYAGGREYDATVMFTDIRGFTRWSEGRSAREILELVNRVNEMLFEIVWEYGGTVDKFMGDGMMAFFGAPEPQADHAVRALNCALAIQQELHRRREQFAAFDDMRIGIGLDSGPVVVGFLKVRQKPELTAIGSTVNLASRLQDATKIFDTPLVLSEEMLAAVGPKAEAILTAKGFVLDGPYEHTPHNYSTVTVYTMKVGNATSKPAVHPAAAVLAE